MATPSLTIFTPTYNRAHTLPRLFESLCNQTNQDFEWLVIDDGSTDDTRKLFKEWETLNTKFEIRYVNVENGGKNRAINKALLRARGRYFMILDSDDILPESAVQFILPHIAEIETDKDFIGISGKRADLNSGLPFGMKQSEFTEDGYVDCTNLERSKYGLERDMAEVFITEKLRRYHFDVWSGEKFTPEEVVWNQIALDGYKLRWYNKITYLCEYQQGGLSDSTWRLLRDNPMGYAKMFDQRLHTQKGFKSQISNAIQYGSCCFIAKEYGMLSKSNLPWLTLLVSPISWIMSLRRKRQFSTFLR